jgi:hypothetical protein
MTDYPDRTHLIEADHDTWAVSVGVGLDSTGGPVEIRNVTHWRVFDNTSRAGIEPLLSDLDGPVWPHDLLDVELRGGAQVAHPRGCKVCYGHTSDDIRDSVRKFYLGYGLEAITKALANHHDGTEWTERGWVKKEATKVVRATCTLDGEPVTQGYRIWRALEAGRAVEWECPTEASEESAEDANYYVEMFLDAAEGEIELSGESVRRVERWMSARSSQASISGRERTG